MIHIIELFKKIM